MRLRRSRWLARLGLAVLVAGSLVWSAFPAGAAQAEPTATDVAATTALTPLVACSSTVGLTISAHLIGLPTSGATITTATLVAASGSLPEYCAIAGAIAPVDPSAPDIDFGVDIPTQWNGNSWQVGGSGMDGSVPNLTANFSTEPADVPSPLAQGYATYGSDSGHQGQSAAWALNSEAWLNFSYEQIKKTHDVAMQVMKAMYGQTAHLNYWMGGSQGGREGLEAITRYPNDYNGAVVAVPLAYFSSLLSNPPYLAAAQISAASWIPPAKQSLVAKFILKKCDGLDGATDGVINDYLACDSLFDPTITAHPFAAIRCPGGADTGNTCLSDAQITTLGKIYGPLIYDYSLAGGEDYYPGWGTGMEGISPWLWEETQPTAGQTTSLGGGWTELQALFSGNSSGTFDLGDVNLTALKDKIRQLSQDVDISGNLSGWLARGGKLIMLTNASDSISNPRAQTMLYNSWVARYGLARVERSVKYYVQPNESHFEGGVDAEGRALPTEMDLTGTLTRWVEQGTPPPDQLVATNMAATAPYTVTYSKPACAYPEYPKYRGTGALTDASSYVCGSPLSDLAQLVSSDHLSQQLRNALDYRIDRVRRNLDSTAAACRSADSLIAFMRAAEGNRRNSLTSPQASALTASVNTEWLAIGCQTLDRTVQSPR